MKPLMVIHKLEKISVYSPRTCFSGVKDSFLNNELINWKKSLTREDLIVIVTAGELGINGILEARL